MTKSFPKKNTENISLNQAFEYGVSLYQHNKKQEARTVFEEILANTKSSTQVLQVLAILDEEDGAWQRALERLEEALKIEPENHSLWFDKAQILAKQGFNKEAQKIANKLLEIAPNNPELLALQQQITTAISKKKPVAFSKKNLDINAEQEINKTLALANQMLAQKEKKQAKMLYQAILAIACDQVEALLGLARLQIDEEQFALAKHTLLRAYNVKTPNKEVLILLIHCEIKIEQFKQAKQYCQQGIKLWHNDVIFYRMLILSFEKASNWQEAYKYGHQFVQRFPDNQDLLHRFATASFMQLRARHNFTPASFLTCEAHLQKAMKNADEKNHSLLSTFLAEVYWYKGEAKKAKDLLEKYLSNHPEDIEVGFNISFVYRSLELWSDYYRSYEFGFESGHRLRYYGERPLWDLSRPKDDIVLVLPEQGVGDEILNLHNLELVLTHAQKVYLACDFRLEKIVNQAFPMAITIPIKRKHHQHIDIPKKILNEITSWIAQGSLAGICYRHFNRHYYNNSYITISDQLNKKAQQQLAKFKQKNQLVIGICWRSGLAASTRNMHYLTTEEVAYLLVQIDNAIFINLQYDDCTKELKKIEKIAKAKIHQIEDIDLKNDFAATAALINNLDTVITAGTAIHRLTGAVGTQCHVFFARTNESDYTKPKTSNNETAYYYPPMLENKHPMLDFIAAKVTS